MMGIARTWKLMATVLVATWLWVPARTAAQEGHEAIQEFFQRYFDTRLQEAPEFATFVGRYENAGKWNDWSKNGIARRRAHMEDTLRELDKFSLAGLADQDQLSARLLRHDLGTQLEAVDLETYLLRVGSLSGLHTRVCAVFDRMPARTVRDYENLLSRLHGVPAYVDQNIALLNEAIARGLVQPRVVVDLVVKRNVSTTLRHLLDEFKLVPGQLRDRVEKVGF